jgi:hypothetical protein
LLAAALLPTLAGLLLLLSGLLATLLLAALLPGILLLLSRLLATLLLATLVLLSALVLILAHC